MIGRAIRWLAVGLFVACVAAWVLSYWRSTGAYVDQFTVGIESGEFFCGRMAPHLQMAGIWWDVAQVDMPPMAGAYPVYRWRGFGLQPYGKLHDWGPPIGYMYLPLWFCTASTGAIVVWLWRKKRPGSKGFPVEINS